MSLFPPHKDDAPRQGETSLAERNRQSLFRFAVMGLLSVALAFTAPAGLWIEAFSSLLFIGATTAAVVGGFQGEPLLNAPALTRWDEAAALLALSLLAGWFGEAPAGLSTGAPLP